MNRALGELSRWLSRASLVFAGLGLVAMVAVIGWQVFARYVLKASPAWSEQVALVILVAFIAFAAAAGVREGFHIRLSMLVDSLPARAAHAMRLAAHVAVLAFGVGLGVYGGELVARTWDHVLPSLALPRGAAYLPLPISGWLMAFFAGEHLIAEARNRTVEPQWK